jgi:two-component system, LytTR family, response regulator
MMPRRIRTLVVDDQPVARERIVSLLAVESDVEVVGECATGGEAVRAIRTLAPDLVFLDMQMPELDGLAVVDAIGSERMPYTIFVTAYDDYAVRAFDAQAIDYLLKPFARPRFARAVERARQRLQSRERAALTGELLQAVESMRGRQRSSSPRLVVKSGGRVLFVDLDQIDWVEAEGNYARLHVGADVHLVRETMTDLLVRLGDEGFARVHRSAIVNVSRVAELRTAPGGDYDVVLTTGAHVPLSRSCREAFQARLTAGPSA